MKKVAFIIGLGVGYVLGARAGRQRYEQIASAAKSVWDSKPVQAQVDRVEDGVKTLSAKAGDAALDGVKTLAGKVIDSRKSSNRGTTASGSATPPAPRGPQSAREATN